MIKGEIRIALILAILNFFRKQLIKGVTQVYKDIYKKEDDIRKAESKISELKLVIKNAEEYISRL